MIWFGWVQAQGFVFDEQLLGRAHLLERLISLWHDGARLARDGARWYLVGLPPRRVDSRTAPGAPLVWREGRWLTGPVDARELGGAPVDAVLDVVGGQLRVVDLRALEQVHPAELLELEVPRALVAEPLAPPPSPVVAAPPRAEPASLDAVFAPLLEALGQGEAAPRADGPPREGLVARLARRFGEWRAARALRLMQQRTAEPVEGLAQPEVRDSTSRVVAALALGVLSVALLVVTCSGASLPPSRYALWVLLSSVLLVAVLALMLRPRAQPEQDAPVREGLFSRLGRWLRAAREEERGPQQGGDAPGREGRTPREDGRAAREGLSSRLGRWLGTPRQGERARQGSSTPGLTSRLGRWVGSEVVPRVRQASRPGFFARLLAPTAETPPRDPPPVPRRDADRPGFFARLFGGQSAQRHYLEDLRRRFTLGDLGEALRRAVPLSDRAGGAGLPTGGVPGRRSSLSLFAPNAVGAPSMVMPTDEFAEMKRLYREAADTLIARGQIDEAAFVLAKLLNDAPAAVALLEQHGKLELAAQVATAQHLPESDRIRLWLRAGRHDEAIRIVRASRDFGALVVALTSRAPDLARQLRLIWGDYLAERQRFTDAIVATAPLDDAPPGWDTWVERSLELGGAAAATALAVDAGRHPEAELQTRERLGALLEQDPRLTPLAADALLRHAPKTKGPLHRDLWRRLMRQAADGAPLDKGLTARVLQSSGDSTLEADAVAAAPPKPPGVRGVLEVSAPAVQGLAVLDAVALPKRRRALAHGAAGLRVVSPTGETVRHHLVKADALVAGPLGATVLVLSLDGELTRVWKLDPGTLALTNWFQGRIAAFARRTDGLCWAVGMESSLVLLDPAAPGPMEWWRVPRFEVRDLDATEARVSALGTDPAQQESWRLLFDVGTQQLVKRYGPQFGVWARGDTHFRWEFRVLEDARLQLMLGTANAAELLKPLPNAPWRTLALAPGLVLARVVEGNTEVSLVEWPGAMPGSVDGTPRLLARLWGTREVVLRELGPTLLGLCDEHGRVTEIELG